VRWKAHGTYIGGFPGAAPEAVGREVTFTGTATLRIAGGMLAEYWLALLLVRAAENHTGQTWPAMRRELQRIAIGTFTGPAGTFRQRTDIPKTARDLLTALKIDVPRKIHELTTPES
jgi:hypothetical protein